MTAKQELDSFLAKYSQEIEKLTRAAFSWMRKKFPAAAVIVYDNYNALVIGFGTSGTTSDAVFSLAAYPRWINLFFLRGATLPDPKKILQGNGKQVRSITIRKMNDLTHASVIVLIDAEARRSGLTKITGPPGKIVIKSISAKQRPRKPK
jgi:hypothetical protein